ncbi:TRAP transporter small permease [Zobellella sp. DQSA1]|uniref:TRAP transporter small permease n=1 Tax=Zobellella sp. DQSA1 TaxID=3342386 RepID=UPI0035C1E48E
MDRTVFSLLHKRLLLIQRLIMGFSTLAFSILIFIQVFIRYFLDIPLYGVEEISVYLAVWLYFIGAGYGIYRGNHISAGVMDIVLSSPRARAITSLLVSVISLAIICWVFWIVVVYFQWSLARAPKSPELRISLYFIHAAMLAGTGLMLFYTLIELAGRICCIAEGRPYLSLAGADDHEAGHKTEGKS